MASNNLHLAKRFDLFIFDWDGTLNRLRLITILNEKAKRTLGVWNKDSAIRDFKSMDYNLKRRIETEEEYKNGIVALFASIFLFFSKPKLHNDTMELLKELKRRGKKIALLSNARGKRLMFELAYLGISGYFDMIVSARDFKAMKPNPTSIKGILHTLKAKPESAIYVGDMVDDMLAAKLAGIKSCAVADGFDSYHTLKSMKPDYIFNGIEGLKEAL